MNKLWKAAGILGGMLVVTAGSGTLVLADETSTEVTDDNSGSSLPHCQVMNSRKRQPQRKIFVAAVLIGGLKQKNPRLYQGNKNFSIA